jgi:predicted secreted acid phosphatase
MSITTRLVTVAALTVAMTAAVASSASAAPTAPAQPAAVTLAATSAAVTEQTWLADVAAAIAPARAYVEQRTAQPSGQPLAIVFDIDNTTLATHFHPFTDPGIAPVVELAQYAHSRGVALVFVSARPEAIDPITRHSLSEAGYTVDELYSRDFGDLFEPIQQFKTDARTDLESQGYTIIASIGNNWTDLDGGHAERTFKLPDYDGLLA